MNETIDYLARNRERFEQELIDFVAIPSISAKSENAADMTRAAEWLMERMRDAGLQTVELLPTPGHPLVVGEWRGAPGAPTLLVYGHYDVQPPEPLGEWESPPFEPEIRDGKLYGRGSVDDKGQLYMYLKAVEAHLEVSGTLPVNLVFLVEGEEEVGSPNLEPFLAENRDRFACDAVLISDTGMFAPGMPSITVGLRGMTYMEVRVQGPRSDLHSGSYGGAVVNPANVLARMIARMHDDHGRIAIPGFYDDVEELDAETREAIRKLPFRDDDFREEVGAPELGGEAGFGTLERIWARPTLDVNGLLSGYTGEGAKTVLPARAMAKVSMRLVPNQDSHDIARKFERFLTTMAPPGVSVHVEHLHGGEPWKADPVHPIFAAAAGALEDSFGRPPVYIREGGSIPVVRTFEEVLGAPGALLGFALPGANAHAPNEWFSLDNYVRGTEALARLFNRASTIPTR